MRESTRIYSFFKSLYLLPLVRVIVVRIRIFYYVSFLKRIKFFNSELAFETTLAHNMKGLRYCNNRIALLIRPLSVLEFINVNSQALVIGPRNEHDLFYLAAHGFARQNIRGLDLISYSDWVDLGDMHATPYPDNRFDCVIVGWTLSYSRDPQKFAAEMLRIAKNNGVLAIGVEYSTMTENDEVELMGYAIQEFNILNKRINSVSGILELFGPHVGDVYFNHDAPRKRSHQKSGLIQEVSNVAVIFSVKK